MARTHPHTEATYRAIPFGDDTFAVGGQYPGNASGQGQSVRHPSRR